MTDRGNLAERYGPSNQHSVASPNELTTARCTVLLTHQGQQVASMNRQTTAAMDHFNTVLIRQCSSGMRLFPSS